MFSCLSSSFFHNDCNDYCHYCFPTAGKNANRQEICGVQDHPPIPAPRAGNGTHKARNPWRETCGCRRADAGTPAAAGPGSRGCKWPPWERDRSGSRSGLRVREAGGGCCAGRLRDVGSAGRSWARSPHAGRASRSPSLPAGDRGPGGRAL